MQIIHVVSDGYSQLFALAGLLLGIPVVGSFHTDIIDLLSTHGAYGFQKMLVHIKEGLDSLVLDSCATTSVSFQVRPFTSSLRGRSVAVVGGLSPGVSPCISFYIEPL